MLWQERRGRSARRRAGAWRRLNAAIVVAFAAQIALGLISYYIGSLLGLVLLWAFAAALLLIWLRVLLHHALLDEATDIGVGPLAPCPECHRLVPSMNFCPMCGVHRQAGRKQDRVADGGAGMAPSHG